MQTTASIIPDTSRNRKSSFYFSFFSLPRPKRDAIETIYAFCRFTDDIVDEVRDEKEKHALLLQWTEELKRSLYGVSRYTLLNKLAAIIQRFHIPVEHFYELIKGMEMDLMNTRYGTFVELEQYCYRVASTVGLICAEIFGYTNEKTKQYAINLGIALQLTNILRDIKSDIKNGRVYLPLEDLKKFNYTEEELLNLTYNEHFVELMKFECERAHEYFRRAKACLAEEDKPLFTAARTMGNIYYLLLLRIERAHYDVFSRRIRLSSPLKILVAMALQLRKKFPKNFHRYVHTELPA
jgi:15-cis-phytoene synthase